MEGQTASVIASSILSSIHTLSPSDTGNTVDPEYLEEEEPEDNSMEDDQVNSQADVGLEAFELCDPADDETVNHRVQTRFKRWLSKSIYLTYEFNKYCCNRSV